MVVAVCVSDALGAVSNTTVNVTVNPQQQSLQSYISLIENQFNNLNNLNLDLQIQTINVLAMDYTRFDSNSA